MYKALYLYPMRRHHTERVYPTESLQRRIAGTVTKSTASKLSLLDYFDLAEIYQWDITRDVNYAYAQVLYPPEDIIRRVRRWGMSKQGIRKDAQELANAIHMTLFIVQSTIEYGELRTVRCYARIMQFLAKYEQAQNFSDALSFEE